MMKTRMEDILPGKKRLKRAYVAIMLWIVGRAIGVAARVDEDVKREFEELPEGFSFALSIYPQGPCMTVGKDEKGNVKFMGLKESTTLSLKMNIKTLEAAILIFTFRESTAMAYARERFFVDGDIPDALAVVRVLNRIETYLLPKFITKMAVKRYPTWSELSPLKKHWNRIVIYLGTFTVG